MFEVLVALSVATVGGALGTFIGGVLLDYYHSKKSKRQKRIH